MRLPILLLTSLLLPAPPAFAQVTIDLRALDQLPNARSPAPRGTPSTSNPPRRASASTARSASPSAAAVTASRSAPAAVGGATQPGADAGAPVVSPPEATLPVGTPPPPSSLQAAAAPQSEPAPTMVAAAVRVSFPAAKADLGAEGTEVIRQLVQGAPNGENTSYNVVAFAPAIPDDPSAARRLSLSRALAVRSALMADGVPSTRIYVRALGSQTGGGPADRADVSVLGSNAGPGRP